MTLMTALRAVTLAMEESLRVAAMRWLLTPAARWLPRGWAMALADAVGLLLLVLPRSGLQAYCEVARAFDLGPVRNGLTAWRRLARPMRDFVFFGRLLHGREEDLGRRLVERNADGVSHLRAAGESFIVATAHVSREATAGLYYPLHPSGHRINVIAPVPTRVASVGERRAQLYYGTACKALALDLFGQLEQVFVSPEHARPGLEISRKLRDKGTIAYIHVDAPWSWRKAERGVHERPFAGACSQVFATGIGRLARAARCPIVTCIPYLQDDHSIVLEWGTPFHPGDDDVETLNTLLDTIEVAVAKRPEQYMLQIGRGRRWKQQLRRWEARAESALKPHIASGNARGV